jgi:hypothetical protein
VAKCCVLLLLTITHLDLSLVTPLLPGGGAALLNAHDLAWAPVLGSLVLGLRHLGRLLLLLLLLTIMCSDLFAHCCLVVVLR